MHFDERAVGDYKIYTGAIETPSGFVAAVAVRRMRGSREPEQLFFDDALDNGKTFDCPRQALAHAMARGWFELQAHATSGVPSSP